MPAPEHLSPSGWDTWATCPRQWAAKYLEGIVAPSGPEADVGTFGHLVLENLFWEEPANRTIATARGIAGQRWNSFPPVEAIEQGKMSEQEFKKMAWDGIVGDFKAEDPTKVKVVALEHEAKWEEGGLTFLCKIDRINEPDDANPLPGLENNDYKTGKVPKKERMPKAHRQVVIEAMGCAATVGAPGPVGYLIYTTKGKRVPVDTSLSARLSVLKEARGVWDQMRSWIESGASWEEYPAEPQSLCGFCPAADKCVEGRQRVLTDLATWGSPGRGIGFYRVAVAEGYVEEEF